MLDVVFYSPHFGQNTLKFVRPIKDFEDVNLIGLGQDSLEYIDGLNCFNEFFRVDDATNEEQLTEALKQISQGRKIDKLLNTLEEFQIMVGRLREKFGIEGLDSETAKKFRDKALMKQIFKENGILCANYGRVESDEDAKNFISQNSFPIIAKPLKGAGCINTFLVFNEEQFGNALNALKPSPENPSIFEEFIQGAEGSFDTFTVNGEVEFYSITTYNPPLLDAMMNDWIQPIYALNKNLRGSHNDEIKEIGKKVIKTLGLKTAMTHMEWFRRESDGKIYIGEIAARPPGHPVIDVHNFGHDIDIFREWGKLMIYDKNFIIAEPKHNVGAACLRAQGEGQTITGISGVEEAKERLKDYITGLHLPEIDSPKTDSYVGEGLLFCRGEDFEQTLWASTYGTEIIKIHC